MAFSPIRSFASALGDWAQALDRIATAKSGAIRVRMNPPVRWVKYNKAEGVSCRPIFLLVEDKRRSIISRRLLTRAALCGHGPQSRDREEAVEDVPHKSLWLVGYIYFPALFFA
jgi:hypothetical protein